MTPQPRLLDYDLGQGVRAFSTTRHGGCSKGTHGSFNINEYCGDLPEHILANKQALATVLGIPTENIVMPHQTHQTEVRRIGTEFLSLPETVRKMVLEGVDALVTDLAGICIGVSTADCIPVALYDEEHHAIAAIHAGWRGTVARITSKAVAAMALNFHTNPSKLRAVIGPGISLDSFEVGQEVYDAFAEAAFDMDKVAKFSRKWHIDLPLCNRQLLIQAGIQEDNIQMAGICTMKNADDFFSARALGTDSGRIFTGIMLTK